MSITVPPVFKVNKHRPPPAPNLQFQNETTVESLEPDRVQRPTVGSKAQTTLQKPDKDKSQPKRLCPPRLGEPRLVDREQPTELPSAHVPISIPKVPITIQEEYQDPTPEMLTEPKPLISKIDQIISGHIPQQREIERVMQFIKKKIIRDYNLPFDVQKFTLAQQASPTLKPVYDCLAYNILPSQSRAAKSVQMKAEQYLLCNGILFRIFFPYNSEDFLLQLAIPEEFIDPLIGRYHDSLLSSHQGCVRTYLTMRKNFYFPNMFERITAYIQACTRCQQFRSKTDNLRPYHPRVPTRFCPFETLSLDFKSMPTSPTGFKYIMIVCCQMTRFLVCVPLKTLDAETICEALIQKVITLFGIPSVLVTDAATSLTGKLLTLLCTALGIEQKVISVQNHGSLHVERHIQTIADLIKSNLGQLGHDWVRFVSVAQYSYNSFASPQLGGYSPYYLLFLREPADVSGLTFQTDLGLSHSYADYVEHLKQKFNLAATTVLQLQRAQQQSQNEKIAQKLDKCPIYSVGQLVYLHKPSSSILTAPSRKFRAIWCGPFAIYQCLDRTHYLLQTLEGQILPDVFNFNRLKPAFIRADGVKPNVTHLQKLREILQKAPQNSQKSEKDKIPTILDEKGNKPKQCTKQHVHFTAFTDCMTFDPHLFFLDNNNGFASPCELTETQQTRLLDVLENAPQDEFVTVHKARFKAGHVQLLLSANQPQNEYRYWWKPHLYPDSLEIVQNVLNNPSIKCTGSPLKPLKKNVLVKLGTFGAHALNLIDLGHF